MADSTRLHPDHLASLPQAIARPGYARKEVKPGVVHLGIGAFHRAHQAAYLEQCLEAGDLRWGIVGASLRSRGVADQLNPQGGLYTLSVNDASGASDRVMGAVQHVLVAPEDPVVLLAALASPDLHIVTLTITEKGYMLDPASGKLMVDHPAVAHDMTGPDAPQTAPGFLAKALQMRRATGLPTITIISCDNVPHNGARLRQAVCDVARGFDADLADWIAATIAFPQTMIDRIVPATTPEDIAALEERAGYRDEGMVKTEPFTQWVVEDNFSGERPDLAAAGVQLTNSVDLWEKAKLRLLNGAHSTLAYLGALAGIDYIHQVVARPGVKPLLDAFWDEAASTLTVPEGLDVAAYRADLFERFANPSLWHRTRQIAMDGSQKLPQRLLETIAELYDAGREPDMPLLGVAAWMHWVSSEADEAGIAIEVDDPLAETFAAVRSDANSAEDVVNRLLALEQVFPAELVGNDHFRSGLVARLKRLQESGASSMLAD